MLDRTSITDTSSPYDSRYPRPAWFRFLRKFLIRYRLIYVIAQVVYISVSLSIIMIVNHDYFAALTHGQDVINALVSPLMSFWVDILEIILLVLFVFHYFFLGSWARGDQEREQHYKAVNREYRLENSWGASSPQYPDPWAPEELEKQPPPPGFKLRCIIQDNTWGSPTTSSIAWAPDGHILASVSLDGIVQLWDPTSGQLLQTLSHQSTHIQVTLITQLPRNPWALPPDIAWAPDGHILASVHSKDTIQLWDPTSGQLLHTLSHQSTHVSGIVWAPDGHILASVHSNGTIQLWDPTKGELLRTLLSDQSFSGSVANSIAWAPDGHILASIHSDNSNGTIQLWDPTRGQLLQTLSHQSNYTQGTGLNPWSSATSSIAWTPDGHILASVRSNSIIELWEPESGSLRMVLEGHTGRILSITFSNDGRLLASKSQDNTVRLWRCDTWDTMVVLNEAALGLVSENIAFCPSAPVLATYGQRGKTIRIWDIDIDNIFNAHPPILSASYCNAKVVLLGDSGVGKSGLGLVLSKQPFTLTESTHGRRVWTFEIQEALLDKQRKEIREALLWDLAGQPGYRLIHQLHLNEVAVALVVFDARSETDPFAGVQHWNKALSQAQYVQGSASLPLKKFLVAARTDRGGTGVSRERIQAVVVESGFAGYFETSAKDGRQIAELRAAISQAISWESLPKVSSTVLFQQIKEFLIEEKKKARRLISTVSDLYSTFLGSQYAPTETAELPAQFEVCVGRVESLGLIKRLSFGNLVLLQPELLDAYASALVNSVRDEPDGLGSISEEQVRTGDFRMSSDERIADKEQERVLLIAMAEDLLRRELVLREEGTLVFPSQSTKENPDLPDPEGKEVVFDFEGPVLNIYVTLAVRLARSGFFKKKQLWKNGITYTTSVGGMCGIFLHNIGEGHGELTLFFDQKASEETRFQFEEYVQIHLQRRALREGLKRRRIFACSGCGFVVTEQLVRIRRERNFNWLECPGCGEQRIPLLDKEERLTEAHSSQVLAMDRSADAEREREAVKSTIQGKREIGDFDVFLCHHSIDKPTVKRIGEQLKELGLLPWLDEWELPPGRPWQRLLEQQIEKLKTAAVFLGKNGRGPWQDEELYAFLRQFVKRKCPVIPVILPDCKQAPNLPLFLEGMTWVDFRQKEPDPMNQLVWGITGKPLVGLPFNRSSPPLTTPMTLHEVARLPTSPLSPRPLLLPCGHAQSPNARYCGVCGMPIPS